MNFEHPPYIDIRTIHDNLHAMNKWMTAAADEIAYLRSALHEISSICEDGTAQEALAMKELADDALKG